MFRNVSLILESFYGRLKRVRFHGFNFPVATDVFVSLSAPLQCYSSKSCILEKIFCAFAPSCFGCGFAALCLCVKNLLSYLRALPMRAQAFQFGEFFYGRQSLLERGTIVFHHACAALELVHRQAGVKPFG